MHIIQWTRKCITVITWLVTTTVYAQQQHPIPDIGIVQEINNDSLLRTFGYKYLVENTAMFLSPRSVTNEQFPEKVRMISQSEIPVYACNIFIPGDLKVVGPAVNESDILYYVDKVFARAQQAGVGMIVWGSGGSRRVPEGFDRNKAKEQFIAIAKKIATLASKYHINIALENLNSTETNHITSVKEALEIVKAVNHQNLRLCVDIYHMLKENESPSSIIEAAGYVVYCEVAEKDGRTPPGTNGDNFQPYFEALKKIGFNGKISIECRWDNIQTQGKSAYNELNKQLKAVF